jgi:probable HAF family extracellular repeat protein
MSFLRIFTLGLLLLLCASLILAQSQAVIPDAHLTFTTIDVPGVSYSVVEGINTVGDMVGYYSETRGAPAHGFLLSGGNFTFFDYPGAISTVATDINDSGLIVGYTTGGPEYGFLYDGTSFTTIQAKNKSKGVVVLGIDNAGDVVGGVGDIYTYKGFELQDGHFRAIVPPGDAYYVFATGINNFGEVVGYGSSGFAHIHRKFRTIDFPAATDTEPQGVNDSGMIVGYYSKSQIHGFAWMDGKYLSLSYPSALWTLAYGVNASGQVVGAYTFDSITYHGFVTSPITAADFQRCNRTWQARPLNCCKLAFTPTTSTRCPGAPSHL